MAERLTIAFEPDRTRRFAALCVGILGPIVAVCFVWAMLVALGVHSGAAYLLSLVAALCLALIGIWIVRLNVGWVEVGADGVLIHSGGVARYVSFGDLRDVKAYEQIELGEKTEGVTLVLGREGSETMMIALGMRGTDIDASELERRIRVALEDYRRFEPDEKRISMLAPAGRSTSDWFAELRRVGEGAIAGFREGALQVDRLWHVVESPAEDLEARAGAAVALGRSLDAKGKERLRIATKSIAEPNLRIVLESVAAGDDEAIVDALAAVEKSG